MSQGTSLSVNGQSLETVRKLQESTFSSGKTQSLAFRLEKLDILLKILQDNEKAILAALHKDLRKPEFEAHFGDIGLIRDEIVYTKKKLRSWMKRRRVPTPMASWPASSFVEPCPLGQVLIIGPWNYPLQLVLIPLVSAIAAGNTVVVKPSELAPETSGLLGRLLGAAYEESYLAAFEGGVPVSEELLSIAWDHIFFTGSTPVGKIVARKAAEHLSPVTLELGGKSPAFVTAKANVDIAAKRIVFGKFFNVGQTCVATDYILVEESVKEQLLEAIERHLLNFFGSNPKESEHLARVINVKNHKRLMSLIDDEKVFLGGQSDEADRYLAPTIMQDVQWDDKVMQDEIFGPILPVLSYSNIDEAIAKVNKRDKPLALYIFSDSKAEQNLIMKSIRYGGGCINDTTVHVASHFLPFGGVGMSGQGAYHGKYSFERFSHLRGVMKNPSFFDAPVRYPPYKSWKLKTLKLLVG